MTDFQAIVDRVDIEALRAACTDAVMLRVAVHPRRRVAHPRH